MPNNSLTAKIGADTSGLQRGIQQAKSMLSEYAGVAGRAKREMDGITHDQVDGLNRLNNSLTHVGGAFRTLKQDLTTLRNVMYALEGEYSRLSEQQRNTDYGRMVASQINQTRAKIAELTTEINKNARAQENANRVTKEFKTENDNLKGAVEELTGKLGINIASFSKLSLVGAGVSAALKVVADSFMSSGQNVDTWGRTLESASAVYSSFCESLNNGDLSGWFTNISSVIESARDAYDAMDALGSFTQANANYKNQTKVYIERIQRMLKNGRYELLPDGTASKGYSAGQKLTDSDIAYYKNLLRQLEGRLAKETVAEQERIQKAMDARLRSISSITGVSPSRMQTLMGQQGGLGMENLMKQASNLMNRILNTEGVGIRQFGNSVIRHGKEGEADRLARQGGFASFAELQNIADYKDEREDVKEWQKLYAQLVDVQREMGQLQGQTNRAINSAERRNNRPSYPTSRGGRGGTQNEKQEVVITPNSMKYMRNYISTEDATFENTAYKERAHTDLYNVYKQILNDNDIVKTLSAVYEYIRNAKDMNEYQLRFNEMRQFFDFDKLYDAFAVNEQNLKNGIFSNFGEENRRAYVLANGFLDDNFDLSDSSKEFANTFAMKLIEGLDKGLLTLDEVVKRWKQMAQLAKDAQTYVNEIDNGNPLFSEDAPNRGNYQDIVNQLVEALDILDKQLPQRLLNNAFETKPSAVHQTMRQYGSDIYGDEKINHEWGNTKNPIFEKNLKEMSYEELKNFRNSVKSYLASLKPSDFGDTVKDKYAEVIGQVDELLKPFDEFTNKLNNSKEDIVSWQQSAITNVELVAQAFTSLGTMMANVGSKGVGAWFNAIASLQPLIQHMIELSEVMQAKKKGEAISSAISEGAKAPWYIQPFIIAGLVANVIASFASAGSYANGGIIEGASKIGDMNIARVNDGEMILNGSQQHKLFSMLNANGGVTATNQGITSTTVRLRGEDLFMSIKNYMKINPSKKL